MSVENPLRVERSDDGRVVRLVLNRPSVRNAFDEELIALLTKAARDLANDDSVRVVVLSGEGPAFCAGADLNWMKRMAGYGYDENLRDADLLAELFAELDQLPKPLIGRIHGAALGGGTGLAAVCDLVVSAEGTFFGTTEVRLGLVPAVISPYVVRKIGESAARAWFVTGSRFPAEEALRVGLVHRVTPLAMLDAVVGEVVASCLEGGPEAVAGSKHLAMTAHRLAPSEVRSVTVETIAKRRVSAEGREGIRAFLERESPAWGKR
jgi:methylglutaconyl-CoA hydratase